MIGTVLRTGKNYYLQVLLEECIYIVEEKKKISKHNIDDIEISFNSDRENSNEENSAEGNTDKENSDEEN